MTSGSDRGGGGDGGSDAPGADGGPLSAGDEPALHQHSVTVRAAVDADVPTIVALWDEAGMLGYTPDPTDDLARTREHDPGLVLVAESGGRVVGTITGTWDGRRGWIMRLAVATAARRQGIASRLTTEVEARLRARGARQINLLVITHNRDALAFWRERGYRSLVPVVLLTRRLDEEQP